MSKKWKRRESILEYLRGKDEVQVECLSNLLNISESTIRRDLRLLEKEEMVVRTHGGVILHKGFSSLYKMFDQRKKEMIEEKKRIAKRICDEIPQHTSIILDNGTTSYYVAKLLSNREGMTIITNSLKISQMIGLSERNTVLISGGEYRERNYDCIGNNAVDFFTKVYADYAIVNADYIVPGKGFFRMCCNSAAINMAMFKSANHIYMAVDSSKFDSYGNFTCGDMKLIEKLYIDSGISQENLKSIKDDHYEIVIC